MSVSPYRPGIIAPGLWLTHITDALETFDRLTAQPGKDVKILSIHTETFAQRVIVTLESGTMWAIDFNNPRYAGDFRIQLISPRKD